MKIKVWMPICHGEEMHSVYRFREGTKIIQELTCNLCGHKMMQEMNE